MKSAKPSGGQKFAAPGMAPAKNGFGGSMAPYTGNVKSKGTMAKPQSVNKASVGKSGKSGKSSMRGC